jgi:hypothetical protein
MKLVTNHFEEKQSQNIVIPMHRVIVVDCSGSMYGELPKLRTHLKNKLPTLVAPEDTMTLIWFSSAGDCGTIFENLEISTAQDLQSVNTTIDRFLVARGLTGFKDPLEKVIQLAINNTDRPVSLSFMSDGYHNSGATRAEIIKVCTKVADHVATSVVVSYGYYADDAFMTQMAEEMGGEMIGAGDFQSYTDVLARSLATRASGKRKIVEGLAKETIVIGHMDTSYVTAKPDSNGKVALPSNCVAYSFFTGTGDIESVEDEFAAVQVVGALVQRGESDKALELAGLIGDETLFNTVQNAFSKQDFNRVVSLVGAYQPFVDKPRNLKLKQDPNAYNVLTLLMDLADTEGNLLHISHPDFAYSSIGGKRETVSDEGGFKPEFSSKEGEVKAAISTLKFDEDRPNVSILTRREGTVSLPDNDLGFGNSVDSFIWRNYAIIRDGIVNVKKLPVVLTKATYDLLVQNGITLEPFKVNTTYVIDVSSMPVINRSMAAPVAAKDMFTWQFELYKLRVAQKILNSRIEKPEFSEDFAKKYGTDGAMFLKQYGVSPSGFSPKTSKGESVDPYTAKALEISMAGLNTIPKISDVESDIKAGKKLTPSKEVVANSLKNLVPITDNETALIILKGNIAALRDKIIKAKFGLVLGKKWFSDLGGYENTTMEMNFGLSKNILCTAELVDKEV